MAASGQGYAQAQQLQAKDTKARETFAEIVPKLQTFAANGAPEQVLAQYVTARGLSLDDFARFAAESELAKTTRGGAFGGFVRQAVQGLTFGFADEAGSAAVAAINAPFSDKTYGEIYDKELEFNRRADRAMETAHPVLSGVARVAGAAVPIVATAGMGAGAAAPATLLQATGRTAAAGMGYGALSGFGESEGGVANRAQGALVGGAVGGTIGAILPPGLAGGKAVVNKVRSALAGILGTGNVDDIAVRKVLEAMGRDKLTPQQAASRYAQSLSADPSKPLTIADVGGQNTRNLIDQSFMTPGAAADDVATFFAGRNADQGERVLRDASRFLPDEEFHGMQQSLRTTRSTAARPLYEAAEAVPPRITPRVQRFLDDPVTQGAYEKGIEIQRLEAVAAGRPFHNRAGEELVRNNPNFRMLTAVKEGLDGMLEQYRNPTTMRLVLDKRGIALRDFRDAYLRQLDDMNPEYRAARAAWAGPSAAMDAMAMGREVFRNDAQVTARMIQGMSESEREFYRMGVFRAISDKVLDAKDGADVLKRFWNSPGSRNRLRAAFPTNREFDEFARLMDIESGMRRTADTIGNSKTAQRLLGAADASKEDLSVAGNVLTMNFREALVSMARKQIARLGGMNPQVADRITELLLRGNINDVQAAFRRLNRGVVAQQAASRISTGGVTAPIVGAAAGVPAGQIAGGR